MLRYKMGKNQLSSGTVKKRDGQIGADCKLKESQYMYVVQGCINSNVMYKNYEVIIWLL